MKRIGNVARSWEEAERWDRKQDRSLTPDERRAVLLQLKRRAYGDSPVDIRASKEARRLSQSRPK
jgi:hypothetical protein